MKAIGHTKWIAILVVCAALLVSGCTGVTVTVHRSTPVATVTTSATPIAAADAAPAPVAVTFSTPEAAIEAYLHGISHQDIDAILAASAVDDPAEHLNFQDYVERLQAMPLLTSPAPADYLFYTQMNRIRRQNEILSLVRNFAYNLLSHEVIDGNIIAAPGPDRVRAFMSDVNPSRLAGIELVKIGTPMPDLLSSTRYQDNMAKIAAIYGADEMTEPVALFTCEGKDYLMGLSLLLYGDDWKVMIQTSNLAGTSALGTVQETTPTAFDDLIAAD